MTEPAADVSFIREILKRNGYSAKAIEEVLKWYYSSPKNRNADVKKE